MMSRLILFSGGVESTAALTKANKDDIIITVTDQTKGGVSNTYNELAVTRISKYFDLEVKHCCVFIPYDAGGKYFHQIWNFLSVANLWVSKNKEITEVWYGVNKDEVSSLSEEVSRIIKSWEILHPTVRFVFPLVHLSKREQWNLIPDEIKIMVRNCIVDKNCGFCRKCLELKQLKGSILHP